MAEVNTTFTYKNLTATFDAANCEELAAFENAMDAYEKALAALSDTARASERLKAICTAATDAFCTLFGQEAKEKAGLCGQNANHALNAMAALTAFVHKQSVATAQHWQDALLRYTPQEKGEWESETPPANGESAP